VVPIRCLLAAIADEGKFSLTTGAEQTFLSFLDGHSAPVSDTVDRLGESEPGRLGQGHAAPPHGARTVVAAETRCGKRASRVAALSAAIRSRRD
jgi:hypothetical protein